MTADVAAQVGKSKPERAAKRSREELEFLPAMLEVLETPPRPAARMIVATICTFFAVALAWSIAGHIDTVAVAQGQLVTTERVKLVQPLEPSIVRAIHVRDGQRVARGDICTGPDSFPYFQPRIMLIQDRDQRLVLAGEIRAGIILWQQPVASDAEARRIVTEASRLRGMAFRASDPGDARRLRYRAAALETRLVDPFWRETSADLLRLPQAA